MSTDSRSEIRLPDTLTHYYRKVSRPFQTLSDLSAERAAVVTSELTGKEPIPRRLTTPHYLPRRRQIEQTIREHHKQKVFGKRGAIQTIEVGPLFHNEDQNTLIIAEGLDDRRE